MQKVEISSAVLKFLIFPLLFVQHLISWCFSANQNGGYRGDRATHGDLEARGESPVNKISEKALSLEPPQPHNKHVGRRDSTGTFEGHSQQQTRNGHPSMPRGEIIEVKTSANDQVPETAVDSDHQEDQPSIRKREDDRGSSADHVGVEPVSRDESDIFGSDVARRTFMEKDDEYSESELVAACQALVGRISHLSGHLIRARAKNRTRGSKNILSTESTSECTLECQKPDSQPDEIVDYIQQVIGERLSQELARVKFKTEGSRPVNHVIRDGLDAWSVSCVYQAMNPILFGLRVRTDEEVNQILGHMMVHEPEMAECWNRIRAQNSSIETEAAKTIREFVPNAWPLHQLPDKDQECSQFVLLEELYRHATKPDGRYELQILLHWRALIHKHELELESYKAATRQTKETLQKGLLRVFELAGEEPPLLSENPNILRMIDKIVEEAGTLAKWTKTTIFSENIEVFMVEPDTKFDNDSMISADKMDEGLVKCTTKLGLRVTDSSRNRKILLKAEVLLT